MLGNKKIHTKKMNENRGITLIALVTTIIVLIILAGISITTLTGEKGLVNQARNNSEEAQRESIIEKIEADLLKEKTKTGDIPSKEKLKEIIEQNEYNKGALGEDSFMTKDRGYIINYDEIDGWENYMKIDELIAGQYVNYIDKSGNTIKCIVLYDETYNETNGTNYGVQIITADIVDTVELGNGTKEASITTDIALFNKAMNSYNNALQTLYNKAQEYLNSTYANVARCVGSKPNVSNWETTEMFKADSSYNYMNNYNNKFKQSDKNYIFDLDQMNKIQNISNIGKRYWLASRYIDSGSSDSYFYTSSIDDKGEYYNSYMCDVNSGNIVRSLSYTFGFRPVFKLNPNVKIVGGEGTEENPYTLGE